MKVFTQLLEGRSFIYHNDEYSSGFGRYTKNGKSISKEEYQRASKAYKEYYKGVDKSKLQVYDTSNVDVQHYNTKSKIYNKLKKYPYKRLKSVKECEEYIQNMSGFKCSLHGITNKELYNGIAENLYKVLSKYPYIADNRDVEYFCTFGGLNKLYDEKNKEYTISDEELEEISQNDLEKYMISLSYFSKVGTHTGLSLCALSMFGRTREKFCKEHNINPSDDIDERVSKILQEEYKNKVKKNLIKTYNSFKKKSSINPHQYKNVYGLYFQKGNETVGVIFSASNMTKSVTSYDNDVKIKFHTDGTKFDSIVTHELGHALDKMLSLRLNSKITKIYNKLSADNSITDSVSKYATTNIKEFISECFAEYINSENPREVARQVGEIIDDEYKRFVVKFNMMYPKGLA